MTEELYSKARVLYDKICNLETQKNILLNSGNIIDIYVSLRKDSWSSLTNVKRIDCKYLNSNKIKKFILEEINIKLNKLQKEFEEL